MTGILRETCRRSSQPSPALPCSWLLLALACFASGIATHAPRALAASPGQYCEVSSACSTGDCRTSVCCAPNMSPGCISCLGVGPRYAEAQRLGKIPRPFCFAVPTTWATAGPTGCPSPLPPAVSPSWPARVCRGLRNGWCDKCAVGYALTTGGSCARVAGGCSPWCSQLRKPNYGIFSLNLSSSCSDTGTGTQLGLSGAEWVVPCVLGVARAEAGRQPFQIFKFARCMARFHPTLGLEPLYYQHTSDTTTMCTLRRYSGSRTLDHEH